MSPETQGPGQATPAVGEHPDVVLAGIGQDLQFDLAPEPVVGRLQGLDRPEAVGLGQLPGVVVGHPDVPTSPSSTSSCSAPAGSPVGVPGFGQCIR